MTRQPPLLYCGPPAVGVPNRSPSLRRCPLGVRAGGVMFNGNPIALGGPEIKAGSDAPDFPALDNGLQPLKLSQARGKVIVLSAVPSLDTPVCDTETRKLHVEAGTPRRGPPGRTVHTGPPLPAA